MVDSSSFVRFEQQVAGHDNIMLMPTNDLLIVKPSTKKELTFYQDAHNFPEFQDFLPECYGTIRAATEKDLNLLDSSDIDSEIIKVDTNANNEDQNVCLENILHGFTKPCILDLKMGGLLYDEDASEEKRERMINHSITTTSGLLGLRICGMKTFDSVERKYGSYGKKFGATRTAETITEAMLAYLFPTSIYGKDKVKDYRVDIELTEESNDEIIREKMAPKYMQWIIECFIDTLIEIRESIANHPNLSLIGSSLLFVYEGDRSAANKTWKQMLEEDKKGKKKAEEEEQEEEELPPKMCDLRLIDFAHSNWHAKRNTQDPELIKGYDNIIKILEECLEVQNKQKL